MIIWRWVRKLFVMMTSWEFLISKCNIYRTTCPIELKLCMCIDRDVLYLKMEVTWWWRHRKIFHELFYFWIFNILFEISAERNKVHVFSNFFLLKMDYENSHIKFTIEPCLCCVRVTIYCCGHVFLFIILLQFDRKNGTPLLRFLKFPALHWFPTKTHRKIHYEIHDIVPADS